ncbi:hypothetical protein BDP27DRAFT_1367984 [Rhodocollybia butyracea]|uniref:Uncharacterized protein n=1 Tax=Rhodocollybia butyracea TaxID=206335 RepID=A0A9P5U236_9AGAR|nr:hypothetical protein BDP27DRAFT_1367984 [Rhodocollybia butyracea]
MPRRRTASAVAKSKLTPEQKAEKCKNSGAKSSHSYRIWTRKSMNAEERIEAQAARKGSDAKYYLRYGASNREQRLDDARWKRINNWTKEWNGHPPGVYKCHQGNQRVGLGSSGAGKENSKSIDCEGVEVGV